jgi:microcystin degradation protein MlrC
MSHSTVKTQPLRIAYGRIFHEANAFSPVKTQREDFEKFHYFEGDELAHVASPQGKELKGFLKNAELSGFNKAVKREGGVEAVPLLSALAVSNGPIAADVFEWLRDGLKAQLKEAGDLDGVYLAMHGSMRVEGLTEAPEAVLLRDVREVVGDTPVAVSYDLHANLSKGNVEPATVLTGFQTNPHRDLCSTGFRAGTLLIRTLKGQVKPTAAWRKLPMILGGGLTIDFLKPMRKVFRHMKSLEKRKGVLSAHLFMVHCFSDAPDIGWAVHVSTDNDQELAERLADEFAEKLWAVREAPLPPMLSPREALVALKAAPFSRATGTVSMVDVDDAVGTGAPGCNTHLLAEFAKTPDAYKIYLPIRDPKALDACWAAGLNESIKLTLTGLPEVPKQPDVPVHGVIRALIDTEFGRIARLDMGSLSIAICEKAPYSVHPRFWRELGLNPWRADAIVQKALFHYRFFYALCNRKTLAVVSDGASSLKNITNLTFDLPVYPNQDVSEWKTFDRARRLEC